LDWVLPSGVVSVLQAGAGKIVAMPLPEPCAIQLPVKPAGILPAARSFTRTLDRDWWVHSFSRLSDGQHPLVLASVDEEPSDQGSDSSPALVAGPRGSRFGVAVHAALEVVDFAAWSMPLESVCEVQRKLVERALKSEGFGADAAYKSALHMISATLRTPLLDDGCLADVPLTQRRAEMSFHFGMAGADAQALLALLHQHGYQRQRQHFAKIGTRLAGLMTGIIDLVFVHQQRWWIVDYKTNYLGDFASDYAPAMLPAAMAAHDYDLQYLIYSVALHRWLRQVRGSAYDYERDFGGIRYLFLRGMGIGPADNGIFACRPPQQLIEELDRLLRAPGVAA
ncbi:MAG: PD-(D/E)XK nuclease family protein, partial [Xanthomonadales bacterium]|nr:PD-(D/E)XK nuclease family protein [Xanthomonadales bacterium]